MIYGLLNYEQGQTCPANVVTLAENSIRKTQTLAGRALTLTLWLLKFSNAKDHQAITNLVIKLKLSAPVLLQEFYATGLPEYLGILSLLCSALLLRGEVSSAENLMSSVVVAAQKPCIQPCHVEPKNLCSSSCKRACSCPLHQEKIFGSTLVVGNMLLQAHQVSKCYQRNAMLVPLWGSALTACTWPHQCPGRE